MKKKTTTKKKPVKTARPIPPPPPGWEIVKNDDPRLSKLSVKPLRLCNREKIWTPSVYNKRASVSEANKGRYIYALPIMRNPQPQPQSPTAMIRLRLPSEKPTREEAGDDGYVFAFVRNIAGKTLCCSMAWDHNWPQHSPAITLVAWLPGRLPDGILPREPSQEEKWQQEFSEWWTNTGHTDHNGLIAETAWQGFLAAKKGGAE